MLLYKSPEVSHLYAVGALSINVTSVARYFGFFSILLFYRQNHNQAICMQMIDSLNVPVLSTFSYFRPTFTRFENFQQF